MKYLIRFLRRWQYLIGSIIILIGLTINGCQRAYPRYTNIRCGRVLDPHTGTISNPD